MLLTFKSKAAADLLMYREHAKPILDLLGKDLGQGVITVPELEGAIARLEAAIAEARQHQAEEQARRRAEDPQHARDEEEQRAARDVDFATRAYPLLEMLRVALKRQQPVVWGV